MASHSKSSSRSKASTAGSSEIGSDERIKTALVVLVVSVVMDIGGVLLLGHGPLLTVVAVGLVGFGLMGLFQSVSIAFGRYQPREDDRGADEADDL